MQDKLLDTNEMAKLLHCSTQSIRVYIREGRLNGGVQIGKKYYMSFSAFCEQCGLQIEFEKWQKEVKRQQLKEEKLAKQQKPKLAVGETLGTYASWC